MNRKLILALALTLVLLFAACSPAAPGSTPAATPAATATPPQPKAGMGAITGQSPESAGRWPDSEVSIYAAPYAATGDGGGFFALEPNQHPHAVLDSSGTFGINDVPPGTYVLVVGPEPSAARLVADEQNKTRIFTVEAGKVLQLGKIILAN
jgi:hypothetical protein